MAKILFFLRELNIITIVLRLLLASLLGGMIGLERERRDRPAGLRTYIIVCLGACMSSLVGQFAVNTLGLDSDPLRLGAQVISGIGFLGAGTILVRERFMVTGLTTAAGLWTTAVIGLALGIGFYEGAVLGTVICLIAIRLLHRSEQHENGVRLYVELDAGADVKAFLAEYAAAELQILPARSGLPGRVGMEGRFASEESLEVLNARNDVVFALRA